MSLESLLTLVENLRDRIDRHGDALRQREALTRYALIDPLLRALGWDTEDPSIVIPEYSVDKGGAGKGSKGRTDYALFKNGELLMILETKKLGAELQDGLNQVIGYAVPRPNQPVNSAGDEKNITVRSRYFSVTDGASWAIYDTKKPIEESLVASFHLKNQSAAEVCLKALALWRPNVISGEITAGQTPIIGLPDNQTSTTEPQPVEETIVQPTSPISNEEGWEPLSRLKRQGGSKPTGILFPDDSQISINSWRDLQVEIVQWLINEGILNTDHCPIKVPGLRAKRYVVSTNPTHSDGKEFTNEEKIENFYIETNYSSKAIAENVKHIIYEVNQDPAQFQVRLP